jgi:siroheme synthase (precorrin-2 oxidase/ferrochelatase)
LIEISLTNDLSSLDLKIHFYFADDSVHAMDAEIFNNCQRQFINAVRKEEGGLIDNSPYAKARDCVFSQSF